MERRVARGYRIGFLVVTAVALAGAVVAGLAQPAPFVCNEPNNLTAYPASNVCQPGSAALQLLVAPANASSIMVWGAVAGTLMKAAPHEPQKGATAFPANFSVMFKENFDDPDGDFPGTSLSLLPVGGGPPIGPQLIVPSNVTSTGRLLNTEDFGPQPEYVANLNIPDIQLPAPPFWVEVFLHGASGNKSCLSWNWATAHASNITPALAIDTFGAPGQVWQPVVEQTLSFKLFAAAPPAGACCTDAPGVASDCIETTRDTCEADGGLFVGGDCAAIDDCLPLFVAFESVRVRATPEGVRIDWTTAVEIDTVGFRVLRETPDRVAKSINAASSVIPATGAGLSGASYAFLDNADEAFRAERYYLEDLDHYGRWTRHGPFVVERHREAPAPTGRRNARGR